MVKAEIFKDYEILGGDELASELLANFINCHPGLAIVKLIEQVEYGRTVLTLIYEDEKVVNKDFYELLNDHQQRKLDNIIERYKEKSGFREAWEKYRTVVLQWRGYRLSIATSDYLLNIFSELDK